MADKFTFGSAGEIQEVEFALARAGYTHQEVKELTKGDTLGLIRNVLLGHAEVKTLEHVINLNADPFTPQRMESGATRAWWFLQMEPRAGAVLPL